MKQCYSSSGSALIIKICGITSLQDAVLCSRLGADIIGLNFYNQSPRFIDIETASKLCAQLPAGLKKAGVFVDEPLEKILDTAGRCGLDYAQLHGDESWELCARLESKGLRVIKVVRVGKDAKDIYAPHKTPAAKMASYILLDTFLPRHPDIKGGTGVECDLNKAAAYMHLGLPVILAGGLNPENVGMAIMALRPAGVDVCSGIELSPGKKDHEKTMLFIQEARRAAAA